MGDKNGTTNETRVELELPKREEWRDTFLELNLRGERWFPLTGLMKYPHTFSSQLKHLYFSTYFYSYLVKSRSQISFSG